MEILRQVPGAAEGLLGVVFQIARVDVQVVEVGDVGIGVFDARRLKFGHFDLGLLSRRQRKGQHRHQRGRHYVYSNTIAFIIIIHDYYS